jgi:hypothetical protein
MPALNPHSAFAELSDGFVPAGTLSLETLLWSRDIHLNQTSFLASVPIWNTLSTLTPLKIRMALGLIS